MFTNSEKKMSIGLLLEQESKTKVEAMRSALLKLVMISISVSLMVCMILDSMCLGLLLKWNSTLIKV